MDDFQITPLADWGTYRKLSSCGQEARHDRPGMPTGESPAAPLCEVKLSVTLYHFPLPNF